MKGRAKKADTFLVKIMDHEHATWQGKVTWIEGQREQYFRSALELIKLIDDAVENSFFDCLSCFITLHFI